MASADGDKRARRGDRHIVRGQHQARGGQFAVVFVEENVDAGGDLEMVGLKSRAQAGAGQFTALGDAVGPEYSCSSTSMLKLKRSPALKPVKFSVKTMPPSTTETE